MGVGKIVNGQHTPLKPKTRAYYEYQNNNAFRGIKFGSKYADIKDKLKLVTGLRDAFKITNPLYLSFNGIPFKSGQAYFTPITGKLYQVVLYQEDLYPKCNYYYLLKNNLISLFGMNDAEYVDPEQKEFKDMNISWYGEVSIAILVQPSFGTKKADVNLLIDNSTYNELHYRESLKVSQPEVPKI